MSKRIIVRSLVCIFLLAILYFAYYTISPLFIKVKLDEEAPKEIMEESLKEPSSEKPQDISEVLEKEKISYSKIVGTQGHSAEGTVRIVKTEDKDYLRYENFQTINGPDLYVYLATDIEASDLVSLGRLKATEGNINYEIPKDIDLQKYKYALVWCKAFGVLFNYAEVVK